MAKTNTHHGMISGITAAIRHACHDMQTGTQSMDDWPHPEVGTPAAKEMRAQQTFGRLLDVQPLAEQPSVAQLAELAASMAEGPDDETEGPAAAGSAFLGQFIDHDLTLDATTMLDMVSGDVTQIENFRTPRLDLDCVYGNGPEVDPWLYGHQGRTHALAFGTDVEGGPLANPLDLTRNRNARALIGDPRNDENLFVSQVHGRQFVARHNALIEEDGDGAEGFERAAERLRHEYQHRVLDEFLPDVVAPEVLAPLMADARSGRLGGAIGWDRAPDMPVEFSAAAFRFGHSMIRHEYALNDRFGAEELFSEVNRGFSPVAPWHNLDLDRFFGPTAQRARPINTKLVPDLIDLPVRVASNPANLAERNMIRGQRTFCLPSGEQAAQALGFDVADPHPEVERLGLTGNTPLWFYILWEAELTGGKLGALGGTLVAGTILNLMLRDEGSILHVGADHAVAA